MTRKEKEAKIKAIWEAHIKGEDYTVTSWAKHHRSFIKWSLGRYKEGYQLSAKNEDFPHLLLPYNLCYKDPKDKRFIAVVSKKANKPKRGRKKKETPKNGD